MNGTVRTDARHGAQNGQVGPAGAAKVVVKDFADLVRAEIGLAKAEIEQSIREKAVGAGLLVGAGALAWLGIQGLLVTFALMLALVLPGWAAALIVSAVVLLVGAALGVLGKRRLAAKLSLKTAKQSIEEDVAWTKAHLPNART
jgi:hypothetical protein